MSLERSIVAALVLVTPSTAPAGAQEDEEGCKDHPMFSRMPNYCVSGCEDQEFSAYEFEMADGFKTVEGHYWRLDLFDTGKAAIKPESEAPPKAVIDLLESDPSLALEVQGHTDNSGTKYGNPKLSKDRADAVKAYLVERGGIAADRLTTTAVGDAQPVADNGTEEGRAQNRRVVLVRKS